MRAKKVRVTCNNWENIEGRFNVAGVQYSDYQLILGGIKPGSLVKFIGEPSNQYDRMAIRIEYSGISIGYVPRCSIQQSELWEAHRQGRRCIGYVTAFNKTNPTWAMITVQAKRSTKPPCSVRFGDEIDFA